MLLEFTPDATGPTVDLLRGKVALYAVDDGDTLGFLISPGAAVSTAIKLLAAVDDLGMTDAFGHSVDGIRFAVQHRPGQEAEGVLTVQVLGARLNLTLDPTQIAEIAAAFTAAIHSIDGKKSDPRAC